MMGNNKNKDVVQNKPNYAGPYDDIVGCKCHLDTWKDAKGNPTHHPWCPFKEQPVTKVN
jgi:hypothetical protein